MYFAKDEIIELNDKKKYLVIDTAVLDEVVYYKIKRINEEETKKTGEDIYITTINKEGKIYINDQVPPEEIEKIKEIFEG